MIQINIPIAQFVELSKLISCQTIAEKGTVKGISHVRGHDMVITGAWSKPHIDGYSMLNAYSVVPVGLYDGPTRLYRDVMTEHTYNGMAFWHRGRQYVFTDKQFEIYPVNMSYQLDLF